jgi:integrase
MPGAVGAYQRLRKRYPDVGREEYIFLPHYQNRQTTASIFQRQFNLLLDETGLKLDAATNKNRTLYSLRHTALCTGIIHSKGKVNIYNLAKNTGTSVD